MVKNTLGARISCARCEKKITAERLAQMCSVSPAYIRQVECNAKKPSISLLTEICNNLEVSPNYLLQDTLRCNEISQIQELEQLWNQTTPEKQEIATAMLRALLAVEKDEVV